jgi:hypothetical protein
MKLEPNKIKTPRKGEVAKEPFMLLLLQRNASTLGHLVLLSKHFTHIPIAADILNYLIAPLIILIDKKVIKYTI